MLFCVSLSLSLPLILSLPSHFLTFSLSLSPVIQTWQRAMASGHEQRREGGERFLEEASIFLKHTYFIASHSRV